MGVPETGIGELCIIGMEVSVGGSGEVDGSGVVVGVAVGIAVCVSATAVLTVDMAVSMTSVGLIAGVDKKPLQDVNIITIRNKGIIALLMIFTFPLPLMFCNETPNGLRYPLVGGRGQGSLYRKCSGEESTLFGGTNPTSRVHAMSGGYYYLPSAVTLMSSNCA
jgi:hypothetical protein